jgi:chemotaxis protein methyltransferase CheR
MDTQPITDAEFGQFRRFIFDEAGITLSDSKKALVAGRLARRLKANGVSTYAEYFRLLASGGCNAEVQTAVDLLTTNETYFFRESKHFDLLREHARAAPKGQPFRVWSAASSTGEEPYSIAMVLADTLGDAPWEVVASDISTRVLARARTGHYPMQRTQQIPAEYLKRYCLKGTGAQAGTLLVSKALRERVRFVQVNLDATRPPLGAFDVVFLRNVMIYFSADTKRGVVSRVASMLKPQGYLFIGHSESLHELTSAVVPVRPSVYRKP